MIAPALHVAPPTAAIVSKMLGSALVRTDQQNGTRIGFHDTQCRVIVAGHKWACSVYAAKYPGHLILFAQVSWQRATGFHVGQGLEL